MTRIESIETLFKFYKQGFLYCSNGGYCLLESITDHHIDTEVIISIEGMAAKIRNPITTVFYGITTLERLSGLNIPTEFHFYSRDYPINNVYRSWIKL